MREFSTALCFLKTYFLYSYFSLISYFCVFLGSVADIDSEFSLEEIDEKEEIHEDSTDTFLRTQEVLASSIAANVPLSPGKNESASLTATNPGTATGSDGQISRGVEKEDTTTDNECVRFNIRLKRGREGLQNVLLLIILLLEGE